MKNKVLSAISALFLIAPFSLLILRANRWALESPTAEILITVYAILMIVGAVYTLVAFTAGKARNAFMTVSLILNILYAAFGGAVLALLTLQHVI